MHVEHPPGMEENAGTLAAVFGSGVFAAAAAWQRAHRLEDTLRDHFADHRLEEWVKALSQARDRENRVRGIHKRSDHPATAGPCRGHHFCTGCGPLDGTPLVIYPCPTIRALDEPA
jgi:hypothetical protein